MNHDSTITHAEVEVTATTVRLPSELWNRTRKLAIDLGISANTLVAEGLRARVAEAEAELEQKLADAKK